MSKLVVAKLQGCGLSLEVDSRPVKVLVLFRLGRICKPLGLGTENALVLASVT